MRRDRGRGNNAGQSSEHEEKNIDDYKHYDLLRIGQWIIITLCILLYTFVYLTTITIDDFLSE